MSFELPLNIYILASSHFTSQCYMILIEEWKREYNQLWPYNGLAYVIDGGFEVGIVAEHTTNGILGDNVVIQQLKVLSKGIGVECSIER